MPALFDCLYQNRFAPRISLFEAKSYVVGRDPECDIVISHPTVSRRHCVVSHRDGQWQIQDLNSTNGVSYLNQRHATLSVEQRLVFQLGSVTCALQKRTAEELTINLNRRVWGQQQLRSLQSSWRQQDELTELLPTLQFSLSQILGSDRVALLMCNGQKHFALKTAFPGWLRRDNFDGTTTLINAALTERRPFVVNNALLHEDLKQQASVQRSQIKAALAYPIELEGQVIAVIYADSLKENHYFTDYDLDLLENISFMIAL